MIMTLIQAATNIANEYLEAEHISVGSPEMRMLVEKWSFIIPSIDNPYELAAMALENPSRILFSRDEIRTLKSLYFPFN